MTSLEQILERVRAAEAVEELRASLASAALSILLDKAKGGIAGLVEQFTSCGLGEIASSWVGTGQNLPISPEQLQSALGTAQIEAVASKTGISPEAASVELVQILPELIDRLTPNGEVPKGA